MAGPSRSRCRRRSDRFEIGARGFGGGGKLGGDEKPADATIKTKLGTPNAERIFYIRYAFKAGYSVDQIFDLTKIDRWFLHQLREIHEMEDALSGQALGALDTGLFRRAKQYGFSDAQLAHLLGSDLAPCARTARAAALRPPSGSSIPAPRNSRRSRPITIQATARRTRSSPSGKRKIMILGGGPNRIGQGIEFDYCCVHASFALREIGFETVMVNSNPETVSTDYDTSDRLYFEPLTLEDVLEVYQQEGCEGAIVQFGGQTPLNLASALKANGVNIIGTSPSRSRSPRTGSSSRRCSQARTAAASQQDGAQRGRGRNLRARGGLSGPAEAVLRPRGARDVHCLQRGGPAAVVRQVFEVMPGKPVLIDKFLEDAIELDVDCLSDGETSIIGGMLEHIEFAGVHSGDAAMVMPPHTLPKEILSKVRTATHALARELGWWG